MFFRCPLPPVRQLLIAASLAGLGFAGPACALVGGTPTSWFAQVSDGVQFSDNWVLTAAHVDLHAGDVYRNGYGSAWIAARYDAPNAAFPRDDLALLRLASPIAAPALQLSGAALPPGRLFEPMPVTIAGGEGGAGRSYAQTLLREVWPVADVDGPGPAAPQHVDWLVTYADDFGPPYVEAGDSGGGLFAGHLGDSTGALLGITSAALTNDIVVPALHGSAFVQLAGYRGWIDATMRADAADGQQARWVGGLVPEPSTPALWLGAALLAPWWRARQRRRAG